ncbi:MAG: DEAD/DEAH box helicase [Fervidicoccaceae archaeon]
MKVEDLPVDPKLKELLFSFGIVELYPPQEEACRRGIFEGKSIVLAAQTASGKSLLAEILAVEKALRARSKTVYLVPLKALASEKHRDFEKYKRLGVRAALSVGDYDREDPYLHEYDVIVTTYEKMDSMLRHKPKWFSSVDLVVIDEVHYLDDPERGPVLESLVARLRARGEGPQIVALSATVGNPEEIGEWLEAETVVSDWRPVPLREGIYYDGEIVYADGSTKRVARVFSHPIMDLVHDALREGGQTLVFVHSRRRAVELAEAASRKMVLDRSPELGELARELAESSDAQRLNEKLAEVVSRGFSFHHAGLTLEQRRIVERAFREGLLAALFATSTLAAGVNLPARRVVIESHRRFSSIEGSSPIKVIEYKQFAGRAGRPGYDEYGEAVLVAKRRADVDELIDFYVLGRPESIESKLNSPRALRTHVLAYIASEGPLKREEVVSFLRGSLFAKQRGERGLLAELDNTLEFLSYNGFVVELGSRELAATRLGKRVSEVYVDPYSALLLARGSSKRRGSTIGLLHLIAATPDMPKLILRRSEVRELEEELDTLYPELLVGYEDREELDPETLLSELKTALLLNDWINEVREDDIVEKYDVGPGDVRALAESAEWIAHAFRRISELLPGAEELGKSYAVLERRLRYGVKEELVELVLLPGIGRVRARRLYNAGFRSLEDVARAQPSEIARVEGIGEKIAREAVELARALIAGGAGARSR